MAHYVIQLDGQRGTLLIDGEPSKLFGALVGADIRRTPPLDYQAIDAWPLSLQARNELVVEVTLRLPIGPGNTLTLIQGSRVDDVRGPTADYVPDVPHSDQSPARRTV